jgi:diaminohydroxyphosphoribosylaminopyrimidine deaminase / 5-amino-6-(5-phosphoribosylamino)uracil reductase
VSDSLDAAAWTLLLAARRAAMLPPATPPPDAAAADMLDLYSEFALAGPARPMVVGHLGQSLDGRIATDGGDSYYVNGPENIDHLHRMRALADAVIVGAKTVRQDDSRLTTRRVEGPNPARVIIDSRRTLDPANRVFADDGARVIVVCSHEAAGASAGGRAELLPLPALDGKLSPPAIVSALYNIGLSALFVEGGGDTVSRFLAAGALDRLQIAVSPMIIGSGRPGIGLPPITALPQALRPKVRHHPMGQDVLFDCDFRT